ncbi:hypothetical protein DdX_06565 [Ditylenchus destructor]|uniref:Uncharacterized protein n=1 Tax=Ditylenchus destructor TaxID=166010 RepID=A0AAD4QUX3_9BILA|nr:hypothetical protein DdX_15293 [Ditylenchus destructor]KAI1718150.1 hypothetical protein DdX_06565 [Ditylenchus destructor]
MLIKLLMIIDETSTMPPPPVMPLSSCLWSMILYWSLHRNSLAQSQADLQPSSSSQSLQPTNSAHFGINQDFIMSMDRLGTSSKIHLRLHQLNRI